MNKEKNHTKKIDTVAKSGFKKEAYQRATQYKKVKDWTPSDTKSLYPSLSESEAKMAWEMGW